MTGRLIGAVAFITGGVPGPVTGHALVVDGGFTAGRRLG